MDVSDDSFPQPLNPLTRFFWSSPQATKMVEAEEEDNVGVDKACLPLFSEGALSKLVVDRDFDVMAAWGSKWAAASSPAASWAGRPRQGQGRPKVRGQSFFKNTEKGDLWAQPPL